jgi:hypothetical protein
MARIHIEDVVWQMKESMSTERSFSAVTDRESMQKEEGV